jgi:hypothetical protein
MGVVVPGNVMTFLKLVFSIPTLDYIPDGWVENIYTYDDKAQLENEENILG